MNMNPEKSSRSVFIGNIPYDTTEEQLREIFSQAGTITSFRLVYDRDTGKPKGYGFCEYVDVETAQSAMRNLNNHDFKGRQLRVGMAGGDFGREERGAAGAGFNIGPIGDPSPYGEPVEPEQAPEAISRAVASLPPEQMFELMKQMKLCIQNNPAEARNMLLQNPQLAYALLQAQIVMKIVDPKVAVAMLHRRSDQIPPPAPAAAATPSRPSQQLPFLDHIDNSSSLPSVQPTTLLPTPNTRPATSLPNMVSSQLAGGRPRAPEVGQRMGMPGGVSPGQQDGMRQRGPSPADMMGGPRSRGPVPQDSFDPRVRGSMQADAGDPRARPLGPQARGPVPPDARLRGPGPQDQRPRGPMPAEARAMGPLDPRGQRMPGTGGPGARPQAPGGGYSSAEAAPAGASAAQLNQQEQEKAQLIMQVLQLSDEQIQMLPPDQRQSILILKEQIARSSAHQMR